MSSSTHDPKKMAAFETTIQSLPEVIECYLIAGQDQDYILKVIMPNLNEYQAFLLKKLVQIDGVRNVHSSFVLKSVVDTSALPLDNL